MATNNEKSLLNEFFQKFEQIPTDIIEALMKVTEDEDEKNVINTFLPAFTNQFKQLSAFGAERAVTATRQGAAEAEQFLRVSSATLLTDNMKIALPSIGSLAGKLGIAGIIHEIKKIIDMLFELLGKTKPKWLEIVLLIIDQILNLLLGGGSVKVRSALSEVEQNFLIERMHAANLRRANSFKVQTEEEED